MPRQRRSLVQPQRPVVWITGANKGIGREIAKQFGLLGCEVALSARSKSSLRRTEQVIKNAGGRAMSFPCDVTRERQVVSTVSKIARQLGPIDLLINNAGVTVFKDFASTSISDFDRIISTNLKGTVLATKAVLPSMRKRKRGWIVNILSTAALFAFEGSTAYSATKGGLRSFGNVLREEVRKDRIKVTNVYPGPTESEMWPLEIRKRFRHRMMSARSVAEAVLALYLLPPDVVVEDIVLRPITGDLS